jgi:hypothetical protein
MFFTIYDHVIISRQVDSEFPWKPFLLKELAIICRGVKATVIILVWLRRPIVRRHRDHNIPTLKSFFGVLARVREIEYLKGLGSQNIYIISLINGASLHFDQANFRFPFHPPWVEPVTLEYNGVKPFAETIIQLVYTLDSTIVMEPIRAFTQNPAICCLPVGPVFCVLMGMKAIPIDAISIKCIDR